MNTEFAVHEWIPLVAISVGASIYVVRETLGLLGKSPGIKLLRDENSDLLRRNHELEETVQRHESLIEDLRRKVESLELTNQAAVLDALKRHELGAEHRHEQNQALLRRAVTALEEKA